MLFIQPCVYESRHFVCWGLGLGFWDDCLGSHPCHTRVGRIVSFPFVVPGHNHAGTGLLPVPGPSSPRCSNLPWLCLSCRQLRVKTLRTPLLFAISLTSAGYCVTKTHVFVSAGYWAIHCGFESAPASKRGPWPWHRPSGKCPLCRFEANGQLLYPVAR